MRVAIVGSREASGLSPEDILSKLPEDVTELVSGGASGVDRIAQQAAAIRGLPITIFRPNYDAYGKMAPLIRNTHIADYADLVLAFWDYHSRGTAHILSYCVKTGKPLRIFSLPQNP